jgi:hypothetical protein
MFPRRSAPRLIIAQTYRLSAAVGALRAHNSLAGGSPTAALLSAVREVPGCDRFVLPPRHGVGAPSPDRLAPAFIAHDRDQPVDGGVLVPAESSERIASPYAIPAELNVSARSAFICNLTPQVAVSNLQRRQNTLAPGRDPRPRASA